VEDIKAKIVAQRKKRIAQEGASLGITIPQERQVPLVPFNRKPFIICEVKRRSPSKGDIAKTLDAVQQAGRYVDGGIQSISVLTEEDHFGGSLQDLMDVKNAYPHTAVLRKDFLTSEEDLEVSYRAGADAVLLIASILSLDELQQLYQKAGELGLAVLFEIHSREDAAKAKAIQPTITGINSRDLRTFRTDALLPMKTRAWADYETEFVYESGIFRDLDAQLAGANGFAGILVGEGVVRRPELIVELRKGFSGETGFGFWGKLMAGKRSDGPLVKYCGLTQEKDVLAADALGVDLLGFILAPSKRQVSPEFISSLPPTKSQKVGVVVLAPGESLPEDIKALVKSGKLDAIQYHGQEDPGIFDDLGIPSYKAQSLKGAGDLEAVQIYRQSLCPRILFDAFSPEAAGGTGRRIQRKFLEPFKGDPLWIAGGLDPDNISEVLRQWQPELVDLAGGIESAPGIKDPGKMQAFMKKVKEYSYE
jgi:indole-3-glycerol phosphate synthase/phosphoribosylanthranilate isomerase